MSKIRSGLIGILGTIGSLAASVGMRRSPAGVLFPERDDDHSRSGSPAKAVSSRQVRRRALFQFEMENVNGDNLEKVTDKKGVFTGLYRGMVRRERRRLARAYAVRDWRTGFQETV